MKNEKKGPLTPIRNCGGHGMLNHSHQTHQELYSGPRDLREHLERRAQHAIRGEISACIELEMRSHLHQGQEVAKKLKM